MGHQTPTHHLLLSLNSIKVKIKVKGRVMLKVRVRVTAQVRVKDGEWLAFRFGLGSGKLGFGERAQVRVWVGLPVGSPVWTRNSLTIL